MKYKVLSIQIFQNAYASLDITVDAYLLISMNECALKKSLIFLIFLSYILFLLIFM